MADVVATDTNADSRPDFVMVDTNSDGMLDAAAMGDSVYTDTQDVFAVRFDDDVNPKIV